MLFRSRASLVVAALTLSMLQDLHGRVALIAGKTLRKLPLSRALNVTTDGGGASSSSTTMTATLKRSLTWVDLIGFGVGCVVGAGIFVLMGYASSTAAGPAVMLSFALDFVVCLLAGLCYAEFAARHPVHTSSRGLLLSRDCDLTVRIA